MTFATLNAKRRRSFNPRRFCESGERSVGRSNLLAMGRGEVLVHDRAAAWAQLRAMLHHAGGDRRDIRDFRAAELEGVAGALRPRFLAEGEALRRRQRR